MASQNEPKLPGMPGPPPDAIRKRENIRKAFEQMHRAMVDAFDFLPPGGTTALARTVKGDKIKVTFTAGKQDDEGYTAQQDTPRVN